jgi:hypothetical protein
MPSTREDRKLNQRIIREAHERALLGRPPVRMDGDNWTAEQDLLHQRKLREEFWAREAARRAAA